VGDTARLPPRHDHSAQSDAGFAVKPAVMVVRWTLAELQSISACSSPPLITRQAIRAADGRRHQG